MTTTEAGSRSAATLQDGDGDLIETWLGLLETSDSIRNGVMTRARLRQDLTSLQTTLAAALATGTLTPLADPAMADVRTSLAALSSARAREGFTPTETATMVYALKEAVIARLHRETDATAEVLFDEYRAFSDFVDQLGLFTFETYSTTRDEIIRRQSDELLEISTPVVRLWDGVVAVPLIGTLDSSRSQVVMEVLLEEIVASGSRIAIIDITGVPTVDTLVAQHLLKTVAAAKLMGADCIVSGIRPQIAQTMVTLGIDLAGITTRATLADALVVAFRLLGVSVTSKRS